MRLRYATEQPEGAGFLACLGCAFVTVEVGKVQRIQVIVLDLPGPAPKTTACHMHQLSQNQILDTT